MPCSFPSVLIHIHRALWMWPAIIRTVRRGAPGTLAPQSSRGKYSMRKTVTRLLVLQAASNMSRWSSAESITSTNEQTDVERLSSGGASGRTQPALNEASSEMLSCTHRQRIVRRRCLDSPNSFEENCLNCEEILVRMLRNLFAPFHLQVNGDRKSFAGSRRGSSPTVREGFHHQSTRLRVLSCAHVPP